MATDFKAGHRETQTSLPRPLGQGGVTLGVLALPADALSYISLATLFLLLGILQRSDALRMLLRLPVSPVFFAVPALGLALFITIATASRPGRLFPRLWSVSLTLLSGSLVGVLAFMPDSPFLHALAFSSCFAALILAPRLLHLPPQDLGIRLLGPSSLILALGLFGPAACTLGNAAVSAREYVVEAEILRVREWTERIRSVNEFDWRELESDRAAAQVESLRRLSFDSPRKLDAELWRAARVLERDEELAAAWKELVDAVVDGFRPARVPRLSHLSQPPSRYDPQNGERWIHPDFQALSRLVDQYHWHYGRLFQELRFEDSELGAHYARRERELKEHLASLLTSWSDHWPIFSMLDHQELVGRRAPSLSEVLRIPLRSASVSLAPGDLRALAGLDLGDARLLTVGENGCYLQDSKRQTITCFTYAPSLHDVGAEIRVEIHLIYPATEDPEPPRDLEPEEVVFLFPVPAGVEADVFRDRVVEQLHQVARFRAGAEAPRFDVSEEGPDAIRARVLRK